MKRWPGRWGLYGSEDDEYRYFGAEERLIKGLSKVLSRIRGRPFYHRRWVKVDADWFAGGKRVRGPLSWSAVVCG